MLFLDWTHTWSSEFVESRLRRQLNPHAHLRFVSVQWNDGNVNKDPKVVKHLRLICSLSDLSYISVDMWSTQLGPILSRNIIIAYTLSRIQNLAQLHIFLFDTVL